MTVAVPLHGLTLTRRVGAGGEAEVYEVAERPGLVCKQYRQPTAERAAKLHVMVASPPAGTTAGGHVAIAWPTELVLGNAGNVTGFLMPRIDVRGAIPLFQVYNPASRLRVAQGFTWRYLLRTARNVAAIVDSLHRAGYVVGDLNESNLLVDRRALVSLVDCDSMQVADGATGRVHRSPVGKPEFLAPELHGVDLSSVDRTPETDGFALTVLICQLLMEGVHPFAGVWRGKGEPPEMAARIRRGWSSMRPMSRVAPPPHAVPFGSLPSDVRRLVRRGLSSSPGRRPGAWEWVGVLEQVDGALRTCRRSEHHLYARRLVPWPLSRRCPWCARIRRGLPDPFPGPTGPGIAVQSRRFPPIFRACARKIGGKRTVWGLAGAAIALGTWRWPVAAAGLVPAVALARAVTAARGSGLRKRWRAARDSVEGLTKTLPTAAGLAVSGLTVVHPPGWQLALRATVATGAVLHAAYRSDRCPPG